MLWDGRTVYSVYGYTPKTTPAIKWHRLSNGNWRGSDRTASEDIYETSVTFRGPIAELTDLETTLNSNRNDFSLTAGVGEEIFGADVDHTASMTVDVMDYAAIRQVSFKVYSMRLKLRILSPTLSSVAADITNLRLSSHSNKRESEFDITKQFTYDGDGFSADHAADPGTFTGSFEQTTKEMPAIRRYLLTTSRTATITMPSFGDIDYPFGTRMGTGPFNVKIIKWADTGRKDYGNWGLDITFGREF